MSVVIVVAVEREVELVDGHLQVLSDVDYSE